MNIGIIGSGNIGSTLARRLTALGHQVLIANSRGPASLAEVAAKTGATAATVEQAARAQDVVIIAVPEKAVPNLPRSIVAATSAVGFLPHLVGFHSMVKVFWTPMFRRGIKTMHSTRRYMKSGSR
jgi:ketol-acid reductoisomerase